MRYVGGGNNSFRENRPKEKFFRKFLNILKKNKRNPRLSGPICRLHNPYHKEKPEMSAWRRYLGLILLWSTIIAWLFIMIYSPYFRLQKIIYSGLEIIKKEDIDNDIRRNLVKDGSWWPKNNFFFLSEKNVANYLNERYLLNNVTVTKIFPDTLEIDLEEKISSVIYDNTQGYYLLDQEGRVIKELGLINEDEFKVITSPATTSTPTTTEMIHEPNYRRAKLQHGAYPIIFDKRNATTTLNEIALPEKIVQSVIFWSEAVEKQGIPRVKYFELEGIYSGIKAYNESVWDVFFQPHSDWQSQINVIKNILKTTRPTDYIDVRYEGRVYWK
ncbi:MAG TPA: FtsQ-type POTRA domain-containing protein [Patescibacteria group bacterium]|nr:FtsQ-type POTRA domain-containing protein [Patescibacteria group bacterium]